MKKKVKITAESDNRIVRTKVTLEGTKFRLKPSLDFTKHTSKKKEIEVKGKLNIFFFCKGEHGSEVKLTIENLTDDKKVLDEKKVVLGDDEDEALRIGRYTADLDI